MAIETGSNQAFIFDTNKQRLQLAASSAIRKLGYEWISEACRDIGVGDGVVEHVTLASGLAELIAPRGIGSQVIEWVTAKAALSGLGIDVWGVVGATAIADDFSNATATYAECRSMLARQRMRRPAPVVADRANPFMAKCRFSGRPAVALRKVEDTAVEVSASVDAQWSDHHGAKRMESELSDVLNAVLSRTTLSKAGVDGVSNRGWVGIVHADGNGISNIITGLGAHYRGRAFVDVKAELSRAFERAVWSALRAAIDEVDPGTGDTAWFLPIIVGGDDVTAVVDGRRAFQFCRALAQHFEIEMNKPKVIRDALGRIGQDRITLGTGLVFVKPHHPFWHALEVAESLTKAAKRHSRTRSVIDTHVLFESALRSLDEIRTSSTAANGFRQFGGPLVLSDSASSRSVSILDDLMRIARDKPSGISAAALHRLRAAITTPAEPVVIKDRITNAKRLFEDAVLPSADRSAVVSAIGLTESGDFAEFADLITALDLVDMEFGVIADANL